MPADPMLYCNFGFKKMRFPHLRAGSGPAAVTSPMIPIEPLQAGWHTERG
jgi:hypothetical protein